MWHLLEERNDMVLLGELSMTYKDEVIHTLFRRYGVKFNEIKEFDLLSLVLSFKNVKDDVYINLAKQLVLDRLVEADVAKLSRVYTEVYKGEKFEEVVDWLNGKDLVGLCEVARDVLGKYEFKVSYFGGKK